MTGFLLDTSILSALAPERKAGSEELAKWMVRQDEAENLYLPSIAIAEIEKGISKLRRAGATARADRFDQWQDELVATFGNRILAVDVAVARTAGVMEDAAIARGRNPGLADVLIAATAKTHALTLLTANEKHFEQFELDYLNPLRQLPSPR